MSIILKNGTVVKDVRCYECGRSDIVRGKLFCLNKNGRWVKLPEEAHWKSGYCSRYVPREV